MLNDFEPADPNSVQPYLYEDDRTVSLHFDMSSTQSRMRRADPCALDLDYTRAMMSFLLLEPSPATILMIGLGGGSLAKYCHRHLVDADITVVEINPHVIAMREAFFVPPDGERFRVVQADGATYAANTSRRFDVVMVDGFNYDGQPEALCSPAFYRDCRRLLARQGLLVVNLHDEEPECSLLVARLSTAFDGDLLVMPNETGGNRIVFAGRSQDLRACSGAAFDARWAGLAEVHKRTLRVCAARLARGLRPPAAATLGMPAANAGATRD